MIIAISGLDGSGKSTQIEELMRRLRNDGYKVKFIWARGGYTPGFEFIKKCLRRILGQQLPLPGHSNMREKKLGSPFIQRIWLIIAIADLVLLNKNPLKVNLEEVKDIIVMETIKDGESVYRR